jgi:hypothetical protein
MVVASACGVPSSGKPIDDGPISQQGDQGSGGQISLPLGPDAASAAPKQLVSAYLDAVAGATTADGQLLAAHAFMNAGTASNWRPTGPVTVVRQIGDFAPPNFVPGSDGGPGVNVVTGTFEIIGRFNLDSGTLEPPPAVQRKTLKFTVGDSDDGHGGLRLTDVPPPMMLISERALQHWFAPHLVYFWDSSRDALIPDLRYVSRVQSSLVQATTIVNWALRDPSDWINSAAGPQLVNTSLVDPTITVNNGAYVVNLSPSAHALDRPSLLAYQLRWSLGSLTAVPGGPVPSPVEIEIGGQPQLTSSDNSFRDLVPNLAPRRSSVQAGTYAIANGKVIAINVDTTDEKTTALPLPRILNSAKNAGVVLAAVDGAASSAALVRSDGHRESLWIRRSAGGANADFLQVKGLPSGAMSRPQFVTQPAGAVMIEVGGQLYQVDGRNHATQIALPSGIPNISSFSIASDAYRIAFISGGKLYLSVLTGGDTPALPADHPIVIAPGLTSATAVTWSSAYQLLVAGAAGNTAKAAELNADGSLDSTAFTNEYGSLTISQISAYSYDPLDVLGFDDVMLQTSGGAFAGRSTPRLETMRLAGSGGHPAIQLSVPFFQD